MDAFHDFFIPNPPSSELVPIPALREKYVAFPQPKRIDLPLLAQDGFNFRKVQIASLNIGYPEIRHIPHCACLLAVLVFCNAALNMCNLFE